MKDRLQPTPSRRSVVVGSLVVLTSLSCLAVLAGEAPAPVPAEGTWEMPSWLQFVLTFEFVWKGLASLGGAALTWIFGLDLWHKLGFGDGAGKEALAALEAGVHKAYEEFVWEAKKAAADGKLSKDERKMAREKAILFAKEIATGDAKKLLLKWGTQRLEAIVSKIVKKMKEKKEKEED